MKVIAISGSARKDGNTAKLVEYVFEELEKAGIATELVQLAGKHPHGCIACYQCFKKKTDAVPLKVTVSMSVLKNWKRQTGLSWPLPHILPISAQS